MHKLKWSFKVVLAVFLVLFIVPKPAFAYLDPGSGSYLIQVVLAAIAGGGLLIVSSWNKVKNIFKKGSKKDKEDKNDKL